MGSDSLPNFREERAKARLDDILKAAAELFVERGYDRTTIDDVAARIKLTKGAVYYYVHSKGELLYLCHHEMVVRSIKAIRVIEQMDSSPCDKLYMAIYQFVMSATENRAIYTVIERPDVLPAKLRRKVIGERDRYEAELQRLIDDGVQSGDFHEVDPVLTRLLILGSVNSVARWFREGEQYRGTDIAHYYAQQFLRMLLHPTAVAPPPSLLDFSSAPGET
ncbi:MAG: hypothetical protein C7B45_04715 [Sulfobacillus acidophilus]|uniref:HTH tetR-type domain-containing protein n=1 Tax=Sulfobacillus acidophilus TaxID=53633 RepID=A0A2T2WL41_9FIRM|nr:MAG: hypothetical protein C7B45_04715 [Sulfobacillus acidophilus]